MKIFTSLLITATLLVCSCAESGIVEDTLSVVSNTARVATAPDSLASSFEADKAMIEQMGYDTSDMVECGDNYLVGEYLIFSKARLLEYRLSPQPEPKISFGQTLNEESQKIYLEIDNVDFTSSSGQTPYMIQDAVREWNEIGECNLNIDSSYDPNPDRNRYYVWLHIGNYSDQIGGKGVFLKWEPGRNLTDACRALYVNTDCREWEGCWNNQGLYLIMHGLGHIFRLDDVESTGVNAGSIMVSHSKLVSGNYLWRGFTDYDKAALREKYPIPAPEWNPQIEFSCTPKSEEEKEDWLTLGETYCITTNYTNPAIENPTYQYSIENIDQGVACQCTQVGTNSCNLKFTAYGTCKLIVKILENGQEKDRHEKIFYGVVDQFTQNVTNFQLNRFYEFKWLYWNPDVPNANINYTVEEEIFDAGSDKSVTIQRYTSRDAQIRFNDYGRYTVRAAVVSNGNFIKDSCSVFERFYKPSASISMVQGEEWIDTSLPQALNSTITYHCNVNFDCPGTMPERVVADVYWNCTKHIYPYKYVQICHGNVKVARLILRKGDSPDMQFDLRGEFSREPDGTIIRMFYIRDPYIAYPE